MMTTMAPQSSGFGQSSQLFQGFSSIGNKVSIKFISYLECQNFRGNRIHLN